VYKDKKAAADSYARSKDPTVNHDPTGMVIDLKAVVDISIPDRKNKDNNCVDLAMGGDPHRFKFPEHEEAVRWMHKLQEWKDFNVDHGKYLVLMFLFRAK
jgi:hypothetical protein